MATSFLQRNSPNRSGMAKPAAEDAKDDDKKPFALKDLNKRSARFGDYKVFVFHCHIEEYEYKWEGQIKTSKNMNCLLVDENDQSSYCNGQFKLTKSNQESSSRR